MAMTTGHDGFDPDPKPPATPPTLERKAQRKKTADTIADDRIQIKLPNKLIDTVDKTIEGLSRLDIFQRGGCLADIVCEPTVSTDRVVSADGAPRIRLIPSQRLREITTEAVCFLRDKRVPVEGTDRFILEPYEAEPPRDVIATVMARGQWPHMRPLEGLVNWPILRQDGTLFTGPGYDIATQVFSSKQIELDPIEAVTPQRIMQARADIDDLIGEFPFETPAHKASWVAGLLTVMARRVIQGPIPMLIIDASSPGSGKTALADTLGAILTGNTLGRRAVPDKDEEWRKAMLGIGIGAYPIILFDNLKGTLRSSVLDSVLTGTEFQDRGLGINQEIKVTVPTMFVLTTNNATIDTDLVRRSLHCRIVVEAERPEERVGFRYSLPADALSEPVRRKLLSAAAAILVGYEQAGRPTVPCRNLGSFDAWCRAVQHPLVWAGFDDPVSTQDELRKQSDTDSEVHGQILAAWFNRYDDKDHTIGTVLAEIAEDKDHKSVSLASSLSLLSDNGRLPDAKRLGYRLRKWREVRVNGLRFVSGEKRNDGVPWSVQRSST